MSPMARADGAVATSESSSSGGLWETIQKNGKLSYIFWPQGMHTEALSGNRAGGGTDLTFEHYIGVGASLGNGWSVRLTNLGRQFINEVQNDKAFQWQDPYFTVTKSGLFKNEAQQINVDAYLRYYIPVSEPNAIARNTGAIDDKGRGRIRFYVSPSKAFFDGKLNLSTTVLYHVKLNSKTPQERFDAATIEKAKTGKGNKGASVVSFRKDMDLVFDPILAYTASSKLEFYLEWSAVWEHTTNGQWTSIDEPESQQTLSPGVNWTPTKKILINPYLEYAMSGAKSERKIDKASIGVQMAYTFL